MTDKQYADAVEDVARAAREAGLGDEGRVLLRPRPAAVRLDEQPHDLRARDAAGIGERPPVGDAGDARGRPGAAARDAPRRATQPSTSTCRRRAPRTSSRSSASPSRSSPSSWCSSSARSSRPPCRSCSARVSVAVALAFVYLLALASDVSIFALNIGTMIGLGLAIDFSLIMVSRFREELRERAARGPRSSARFRPPAARSRSRGSRSR